MREKHPSLEKHHILPRCIAKAFGLPQSVYEDKSNLEYIPLKEHDRRHEHTEEDLRMVKALVKEGVIYRAKVLRRGNIKDK